MAMPRSELIKRLESIQRHHNREAEFIRNLIRTAKTEYKPDEFVASDLFDETQHYCPTSTNLRNTIMRFADTHRRTQVCERLERLDWNMTTQEINKAKTFDK